MEGMASLFESEEHAASVIADLSSSVTSLQEQLGRLGEAHAKREEELTIMRDDMAEIKTFVKAIAASLKLRIPPDVPAPSAPSARPQPRSGQEELTAGDLDNASSRSARSRSPARSEGGVSRAGSEAARIADQSAWAGKSTRLPKKVKVEALPRLGSKEKEGLSYHNWKVDARATIAAAHGAEWVLDIEPPLAEEFEAVRAWYEPVDKMVYAALLKSVSEVPILSDIVRRLQGEWGSGHKAWWAIHSHYVRVAETNRTFLAAKVTALKPKERESMEAFLNRCEALREEHKQYGIELPDNMLITQVFRHLSQNWRVNTGLNGVSFSSLPWGTVKDKLQGEDNIRRQSNTTAEDATMPLGWTKGYGGAKAAGAGESPDASNPSTGGANKAGGDPPYKRPDNAKKGGVKPPGMRKGMGPNLVCYHCKKSGHVWTECRTKPEGWEPSDEDKAEADKLRAARLEQSAKAKAANGARNKGESDVQGNASAATANTLKKGEKKVSFAATATGRGSSSAGPKVGKVSLPQV
jgi:hypothetical protein